MFAISYGLCIDNVLEYTYPNIYIGAKLRQKN